MRASTLIAVIISLLIGLVAAAGLKWSGLLDKEAKVEQRPERVATPKVLVAGVNLYKDIPVQVENVVVRDVKPEEMEEYNRLKAEKDTDGNSVLLPPVTSSAHLRTPVDNITADRFLTTKNLRAHSLPSPIDPAMPADARLVSVPILKQNSAGGTIRVGDTVDVWLTSNIGMKWEGEGQRTALIARGVKVKLKRDQIWPVLRADPENKPISFTLQANAYRAALIMYAQNKGILALAPSSGQMPDSMMMDGPKITLFMEGAKSISDADLLEAFGLKPPTPPAPPIMTRKIVGTEIRGVNVFQSTIPPPLGQTYEFLMPGKRSTVVNVSATKDPNNPNVSPLTSIFQSGRTNDPNDPDCPTCGKKPDQQ